VISYLDCYPCLVRHALEASRQISADPVKQREVLVKVLRLLPGVAADATPVRIAAEVHRLIRETLGVDDPYLAQKKKYNELALSMVPELKRTIERAKDPLEAAVRIAIAGNIIDFGALGERFDLKAMVKESQDAPLGLNDFAGLKQNLRRASRIVYVGDNAGEIVFDRLLVEQIQRQFDPEIHFVVRGRPILNDATLEDAREVGLTDRVTVVASGGDGPGCELDRSPALRPLFEAADVVISKGQGNYEALSNEPYPIYFLLRIKCRVISRDIDGPKGTAAVKRSAKG
jgi:uncharacterized protein with ATP-grasp and redox domains